MSACRATVPPLQKGRDRRAGQHRTAISGNPGSLPLLRRLCSFLAPKGTTALTPITPSVESAPRRYSE